MTRFRSFRPRRGVAVDCAVCAEPLDKCTRVDVLGRYMCSKHGLQSRRFTDRRLLALCPNFAVLLRRRPKLSGLLIYTMTVKPYGRTSHVRHRGGSLRNTRMRACGLRVLRAARFPKPKRKQGSLRTVFEFTPPAAP